MGISAICKTHMNCYKLYRFTNIKDNSNPWGKYPRIETIRYIYLNAVNGCGRFGQYLIELMHHPVLSVIFSISASSGSNHSESTCHNPKALSVINFCSSSGIVPIESEKSNSMDSTMKCGITRIPWVMRTCYRGVGHQVCNRMKQNMRSSYLC